MDELCSLDLRHLEQPTCLSSEKAGRQEADQSEGEDRRTYPASYQVVMLLQVTAPDSTWRLFAEVIDT
jgi:hypothetical protein